MIQSEAGGSPVTCFESLTRQGDPKDTTTLLGLLGHLSACFQRRKRVVSAGVIHYSKFRQKVNNRNCSLLAIEGDCHKVVWHEPRL